METSDARLAETHAQISHIFESRSQETAHRRETINTTSRFKDIKDDISMCYGEKLNMVDDMLNRLPNGAQSPIGPSSSVASTRPSPNSATIQPALPADTRGRSSRISRQPGAGAMPEDAAGDEKLVPPLSKESKVYSQSEWR